MNFGIPNSRIPRKYKKENPRTPKKKEKPKTLGILDFSLGILEFLSQSV